MSNSDQAQAGTPEGQGPVEIDEELARHLRNKREDLFETFEMPHEFPPEVLEEAQERTENVESEIQAELDDRTDLRGLTTWTTDPVDAQDFDDALSVEEREDSYVLWVHIADVSHYVHPGTAMWSEARDRGNTVYLPGHTVHMLPPVLAETVCSLVPHEDRLAHTVEMHLDKEDLSYDEIDIYKSVIRSDARLTYTECETILDDPAAAAEFLEEPGMLEEVDLGGKNRLVWGLAEEMHEQRKADGSLVLNPRRDRAHTIIEECMLKANKAVTHELMWTRRVEAMYRVHPQPSPDEWSEALREIQELDGVSVPGGKWSEPRKAVNATLEEAPIRLAPARTIAIASSYVEMPPEALIAVSSPIPARIASISSRVVGPSYPTAVFT